MLRELITTGALKLQDRKTTEQDISQDIYCIQVDRRPAQFEVE